VLDVDFGPRQQLHLDRIVDRLGLFHGARKRLLRDHETGDRFDRLPALCLEEFLAKDTQPARVELEAVEKALQTKRVRGGRMFVSFRASSLAVAAETCLS